MSKRSRESWSDSDSSASTPQQDEDARGQAIDHSYSNDQGLVSRGHKLDATPRRSGRIQNRLRRARKHNRPGCNLRPSQSNSSSPTVDDSKQDVPLSHNYADSPSTKAHHWSDPMFEGAVIMNRQGRYVPFRRNMVKADQPKAEAEDVQQQPHIGQTQQEALAKNNEEEKTAVRAQAQEQTEPLQSEHTKAHDGEASQTSTQASSSLPSRPNDERNNGTASPMLPLSSNQLSPRDSTNLRKFDQRMRQLRRTTLLSHHPPTSYLQTLSSMSNMPYISYPQIPVGSQQQAFNEPQDTTMGHDHSSMSASRSNPDRASFVLRKQGQSSSSVLTPDHKIQGQSPKLSSKAAGRVAYGQIAKTISKTAPFHQQQQSTRGTGRSNVTHLDFLRPDPSLYQQDRFTTSMFNSTAPGRAFDGGSSNTRIGLRRTCEYCHRRRLKCDRVRPVCGTCRARGQQCEWAQPPQLN